MKDVDVIRRCAASGLSIGQTAKRLGVTRSTVSGRARDHGIRFSGAQIIGPGCNSEQARKGWETRRANGWVWSRPVGVVRHVR